MRHASRLAPFLLLALVCGCATSDGVRYVYQDGEFGVVGMPENTDRWPTHYRRQAEKLMDSHFPDGHATVRAEEVVEGERTLKLEGSRTAEVAPQVPAAVLSVAKLGRTASRSQSDSIKIKECRIIYRRSGGPDRLAGYADAASTPTQYVDPNAAGRRKSPDHAEGRDWSDDDGADAPAPSPVDATPGHHAAG